MAKKKIYSERYVLGLQSKVALLQVACDNAWACAGQRGAQVNELKFTNDELRKQLQDLREVADRLRKHDDAGAKRVVGLEADLDNAKDALADKNRIGPMIKRSRMMSYMDRISDNVTTLTGGFQCCLSITESNAWHEYMVFGAGCGLWNRYCEAADLKDVQSLMLKNGDYVGYSQLLSASRTKRKIENELFHVAEKWYHDVVLPARKAKTELDRRTRGQKDV